VEKTQNGVTKDYVFDGSRLLHFNSSSVIGRGMVTGLGVYQGHNGSMTYYENFRDQVGSLRMEGLYNSSSSMSQSQSFVSLPFGDSSLTTSIDTPDPDVTSRTFFADLEQDTAGVNHSETRENSATQGRWLSPDPAHIGWNAYVYANNSPVSMSDPSGLWAGDEFSGGQPCGPANGGGGSDCGGEPSIENWVSNPCYSAPGIAGCSGSPLPGGGYFQAIIWATNGLPRMQLYNPFAPIMFSGLFTFNGATGDSTARILDFDSLNELPIGDPLMPPDELSQGTIGGNPGTMQTLAEADALTRNIIQAMVLNGVGGHFIGLGIQSVSGAVVGAAISGGSSFAAGTQVARSLGQAGEDAVGIVGPKVGIQIPGSGITRFPDQLVPGISLTEVKNVRYLSLTQQLRDYSAFAQQNNLQFNLFVRPTTILSGPLQNAVTGGVIKLFFIPTL
jgi:RHS repeat-associated protein